MITTNMNTDNDYDNDGNNIVPCPICLDQYCPSKGVSCGNCGKFIQPPVPDDWRGNCTAGGTHHFDFKCPEEDEFVRDMNFKQALGEQWQTIFLNAGTEKGLGDLSMMIGVVSGLLDKTRTAEQERVVGILQNMKGVYSARDVIEKATEAIMGNESGT